MDINNKAENIRNVLLMLVLITRHGQHVLVLLLGRVFGVIKDSKWAIEKFLIFDPQVPQIDGKLLFLTFVKL